VRYDVTAVQRGRLGRRLTFVRSNGWDYPVEVEAQRRASVRYRTSPRPAKAKGAVNLSGWEDAGPAGLVVVVVLFAALSVFLAAFLAVRRIRRAGVAKRIVADLAAQGLVV
jgi:hypothetical protein